ncbi:zinc finger protein Xfin-like [Anopheles maculipalpis]|uniref:zinc finger protein Xfin-like n=1 Tax=Anopheles maculipalpis TaxID=1496333 RepID=UPI002159AF40|nr:zinc finger protein Xfin-like [Anopheles maculipalpis]
MHPVVRCSWCDEFSDDWREFNSSVVVSGRDVIIRDMIDIFQLPQGWNIKHNEEICMKCLQRLEYCYQFYGTLLTKASKESNAPTDLTKDLSKDGSYIQCPGCDASFPSQLELEKHSKIQHPKSKGHFHYCHMCKKSFKTNRGMLQHCAIYHGAQETYCCHMCERQFLTKTNYTNHMRYHQDHVCCFCNSGWINDTSVLEHVRTSHPDRLFVCHFCSRKERLKKCLNRHLRATHQQESNPYFCGHCGTNSCTYESYEKLTDHLQQQHHEDEGNVDEKDAYGTLLNDSLFSKELDLHEIDVIVKEQELFLQNFHLIRSGNEKQEFSRPIEPRIDQRMVLEDFLDEAFENDEIWNKYIENGEEYLIDDYDFYLQGAENNTEQETSAYACPQCQRGFQKQQHLSVHLAEEHDAPSLVCNDCGASFTRRSNYRTHRREHLKDNVRFRENNIPEMEEALSLVQSTSLNYSVLDKEGGYLFTCNLCDRTFQRKHNLEKHRCPFYNPSQRQSTEEGETTVERAHQLDIGASDLPTNQEIIYCMLCDRRFSSTSGLKYHLKRHTGMKAFACLYCEKRFTANSNLHAHIRNVHSQRKEYRCTECNELFATKDHLNKHQRSRHRQERTYVCGECGKSYLQRSHLNDHVAASHREERYMCNICNGSYVSKSSLKRHQQQKHDVL